MTLRGREVKALEAAYAQIVSRSKQQGYKKRGPVRIRTKHINITVRRSPCGNGTKTFDKFEMSVHKRVMDIFCPSSVIKHSNNQDQFQKFNSLSRRSQTSDWTHPLMSTSTSARPTANTEIFTSRLVCLSMSIADLEELIITANRFFLQFVRLSHSYLSSINYLLLNTIKSIKL